MSASKVYFTDMRCPVGTGLLDKLKKLIEKAGIDSIDMDSKFVAIKIHFGEPGNLSFLRPNFAKVVADKVTSLGGRPFLTDCNTLYVGSRKNALDHIAYIRFASVYQSFEDLEDLKREVDSLFAEGSPKKGKRTR